MFISKLRYDTLIETIASSTDTINTAYEYIEKLKAENRQLRQDKILLLNMLKGSDPFDIDFPNTSRKGGNSANNGADTLGDIFEL